METPVFLLLLLQLHCTATLAMLTTQCSSFCPCLDGVSDGWSNKHGQHIHVGSPPLSEVCKIYSEFPQWTSPNLRVPTRLSGIRRSKSTRRQAKKLRNEVTTEGRIGSIPKRRGTLTAVLLAETRIVRIYVFRQPESIPVSRFCCVLRCFLFETSPRETDALNIRSAKQGFT